MSERPENMDGESSDEIIAGEYVLGVLSLEDRRRVEKRIHADPSFAMRVRRWQDNLENLDEAYGEIRPRKEVFADIEARLFSSRPADRSSLLATLWGSVVFWRGAALASLVTAAGFAAFGVMLDQPLPAEKRIVADLSAKDSAFRLLASYDANTGRLRVTPAAATAAEPRSLELWLIDGDAEPVSLGVLPDSGDGELLVPAVLRSQMGDGKTLAVSLEPLGGSPTGKATGPVLAVGKTHSP
jgi:anti-sigma-K factor RskA